MKKNEHITRERRNGHDRRYQACLYAYPYIDRHGILVTKDRRCMDDRRKETESSRTCV